MTPGSGPASPTLLIPQFTTAALIAQLRRTPPHEFANVSLRHLTAWCHVIEAFTSFEWVANNVLAHVRGDLSLPKTLSTRCGLADRVVSAG